MASWPVLWPAWAMLLVLVVSWFAFGSSAPRAPVSPLTFVSSAAGSPIPTAVPGQVQMAFTQAGGHLDDVMVAGLDQATAHVDVAMYAINRPSVVQAFNEAQHRCSCVRVISDATQSGGKAQKAALLQLAMTGIPIMVDQHNGIMHLKVVGVNLSVVYEGSYNETDPASTINDEVLFTIPSAEIAVAWHTEFETMWNDTKRFKPWAPSLPVRVPAPDDF